MASSSTWSKPIELFKAMTAASKDLLVIDTKLSSARAAWLEVRRDNLETGREAELGQPA